MSSIHRSAFISSLSIVVVLTAASLVGVRMAAQDQPPQPQTAKRQGGNTNTTLVDNDRVRILRLTWSAGGNDGPMHHSASDMILIQLTPGEVEAQIGEQKTTGHEEVGKTWFLPKELQHRFANVGDKPYDFIAIYLKK